MLLDTSIELEMMYLGLFLIDLKPLIWWNGSYYLRSFLSRKSLVSFSELCCSSMKGKAVM